MRKYIDSLLVLFALLLPAVLWAEPVGMKEVVLTGKIVDQENNPLIGVSIYFPQFATGTVTVDDGTFKMKRLPATKVTLQISCVGYKTKTESVDLSSLRCVTIAMEPAVVEMSKIVVTGMSKASIYSRSPAPMSYISNDQLTKTPSTNIIDAIASQPGISQITTGSGISKPVIRGLGYNRVAVINDGVRQEGQQWGDEHGIEIDENAVNHVEILKGPASLAYGSDALAGVINMISDPVLPVGAIQGHVITDYQTNNGLAGYSVDMAGNDNGLSWSVRGSGKMAHDYHNRYDGYVAGSGYQENSLSGSLALIRSWGYTKLLLSAYHLKPGIVEGERDSLSGKFLEDYAVRPNTLGSKIASDHDLKSYSLKTPYQQIHHYKIVSSSNFVLGEGNLKAILGYQQNQRQEFEDALNPNQYGLYFKLNSLTYDVGYTLPNQGVFTTSLGVNGMYQNSENKGTEFLIPAYHLFDFGSYVMTQANWDKLTLSGGIRYDKRQIHANALFLDKDEKPVAASDLGAEKKFTAFKSSFSSVSGSVGLNYQLFDGLNTSFNVSRGFRAPNAAELGANGVHEGTQRYEIGNPSLKAENSLQFDYGIRYSSLHVSAEVNLFYNHISNYIYARKLMTVAGKDSIVDLQSNVPAYKYTQGNANLYGSEISIDVHPHPFDWLHFENTFSFVRAIQSNATDSTKYLPFTPPARYTSELKATSIQLTRNIDHVFFSVEAEHYFAQNNVYSAYQTETPTPGYTLLNCGMGGDWTVNGRTLFSLYFNVQNLTDSAYQSHLSRLKYLPENYATGRTGVYNMGRNFSLKLIIPINIRSAGY